MGEPQTSIWSTRRGIDGLELVHARVFGHRANGTRYWIAAQFKDSVKAGRWLERAKELAQAAMEGQ